MISHERGIEIMKIIDFCKFIKFCDFLVDFGGVLGDFRGLVECSLGLLGSSSGGLDFE